jgi:hypothetical protein
MPRNDLGAMTDAELCARSAAQVETLRERFSLAKSTNYAMNARRSGGCANTQPDLTEQATYTGDRA